MPIGKYRDLEYCVQQYKIKSGTKKDLIFKCFGKNIPHNKLTVDQLDAFIKFLG